MYLPEVLLETVFITLVECTEWVGLQTRAQGSIIVTQPDDQKVWNVKNPQSPIKTVGTV